MTIRVAITGFGRIGRNILRAHYESGKSRDVEIVAINAPGEQDIHLHLLKHDTVHGRFNAEVSSDGPEWLIVNGDRIRMFATRDPREIPWGELNVDVVLECTGAFKTKEKCQVHLDQGAKKVLISAPGKQCDATVVYGVNHDVLKAEHTVVSNASCTTNCLAPLVKPLQDAIGVERGLMTTIHSFTNDQNVTDVYHKDMRRARAAGYSMIPTKTGAAAAVGLVLPELNGKLDGYAVRVPTINVSFVDLTFIAQRDTSVEEVNAVLKAASESEEMKGVLGYNDKPLVSIDFNHDDHSSTYDATLTKVSGGRLVKVSAWYDNEWGFSCRMLDTAIAMMNAK
ncbi:MAG: type I glyceraldehyde-3-phosphate dehydrogenase [Duodenibacillus sp.]|jgi:glyceraldehyde 3-phosphate dehydrogenase|nr:type I glyceraldehyde-3-phosphate dehydrogenase [Duodenibacillus sp.]